MTSIQEHECIFCKEGFDSKEALQIHFRKHGDPNFNQNVKGRLQSSSPSLDSSRDGVEMVSCDVCTEVFPTISKAITHKHKVHPEHDAKYFCPWCGKLFTMKHLYNKHMQANHSDAEKKDDKSFHCDCCNVDFLVPTAVLYHNKFFHRQDTDIPPFGLSKKLKMYNQEVMPIYYCSFCGEEYENKVNLHKHATDDHNDENQSPDIIMRCPLCDAIFYHLDAYEIHLTFHTSEDLYSERSEMADEVNEYSLESVPPVMEKVECSEVQQVAETTMNEVGIEDFLEQALEEPEGITPKRNKKHKKHKKSKKAAITLDEFLNMNKDVFGEGLDFQGIEEVPTRAITKKFKATKKSQNASSEIAPELEKLRKHGIVIKKKPGHATSLPNKGQYNKFLKSSPGTTINNSQTETKISTSLGSLDKIINQCNNQLKIVKQSNKSNSPKFENYKMECDSTKKDIGELIAKDLSPQDKSVKNEDCSSSHELIETNAEESTLKSGCKTSAENTNINTGNINSKSIETEVELNEESSPFKSFRNGNSLEAESSTNFINKDIEDKDNKICDTMDTATKNIEIQNKADSLSSLKHLSHIITVKPVITNKNFASADSSVKVINKNNFLVDMNAKNDTELSANVAIDTNSTENLKNDDLSKDLSSDLDKSVPLISASPLPKSDPKTFRIQENDENDILHDDDEFGKTASIPSQKPTSVKKINSLSSEIVQSQYTSTNTVKNTRVINNNDKKETADLLKHLTGITAKSISGTKCTNENNTPMSTKKSNSNNARIIPNNEKVTDDEIEIFSIDDSDDEIDSGNQTSIDNLNDSTQNINVLKNLCKSITVRSLNNIQEKNKIFTNELQNEAVSNIEKKNLDIDDVPKYVKPEPLNKDSAHKTAIPQLDIEKGTALKNALKNLSKNITVKSRNSSPSHIVKTKDEEKTNFEEEYDDEASKAIEITEMNNDGGDDDLENNFERMGNIVVESPEDSHSDKDVNNEIDMEEADFENQIKMNMLSKDNDRLKSTEKGVGTSGMKGMCKDNVKHIEEDADKEDNSEGNPTLQITKNLGSQISIKPLKNTRKGIKQECIANAEEMFGQTACHSVTNQRMTTSNQMNTVNKEVTVKTFQTQTKTIVQEITTTVTKTIKTVNQTLKQEVRNVNNYNSTSRLPQKVQGMKVPQQSRNLQGIVVRHSAPIVRPKIRNTPPPKSAVGTTVRQSNQVIPVGTPVKPSNQIVPVRPRSNIVGTSNPRMPSVQKVRPSTSNQNTPKVSRPLKVSPEATIFPVKRPNEEETSGPFSCFKKPKESLIPVSDVTTTLNSSEPESMSEYTSLCKSSSINMVSTKGKSVTTSSQMKSEVNASTHQSGRLNISAMKVMKTSQSKQVQVHENNEVSASQRTTLEAIQRLQKQGLLVKKPRLDVTENSDYSNNSDDNSRDNDM